MNSDIDHDTSCVFYDDELKALKKAFSSVYDIFKRIDKRAERRQTVQISRSLFDFVEKRKQLEVAPQTFYDFMYGDVRICIYRVRAMYGILCVGYIWKGHSIHPAYIGAGIVYDCQYSSYKDAVPAYLACVQDWLLDVGFDEVPF